MKYKLLKVFDCQDMPREVRTAFFEKYERRNDVYVSFYPEWHEDVEENDILIRNWLLENGLEKSDEMVIIRHWW